MGMAAKLANEPLQKAKEALKTAGYMKRENKQVALECLQTLYETLLSLSDSRSRHKFILEKEKVRHAYELVRIERAHNKNISDTLKTMEANLEQARNDITGNLEETKAIRSSLGYETQELYGKIESIAK